MKSHDYLMQIRILNAKIDAKIKEKEQLQHIAEGVTGIRYDIDKVQKSSDPDRIGNSIVKIVELEREIDGLVDEYVDKKREISKVLDKLTDHDEYRIIHMYYFEGMTWEQVSKKLNISYRQVMRIKKSALHKLSLYVI